ALAGARRQHDGVAVRMIVLACHAVDEADTARPSVGSHLHRIDQRIRADLEIAGGERRRQQHRRALEVGADGTATQAGRGIETGGPVAKRAGQDRGMDRRSWYAERGKATLDEVFAGPRRWWRQQDAG